MLHYHGFLTRSDITSKYVGWDKTSDVGRSDVFAARNGLAVNIEAKWGRAGFNLNDWREPQRRWAQYTQMPPFNIPYYIYLTIGSDPPHYDSNKYMPRKTWLVPYDTMIEVDRRVQNIQATLVYEATKGMKREIQDGQVDAVTLLKDYELVWAPNDSLTKPLYVDYEGYLEGREPIMEQRYGGFWIVPQTHEFYKKFIKEDVTQKLAI